jgi:site-specific DNA-methyltransferase (adenine-specific)
MIIEGDCLEEMRNMESNSIDCILTDPPYGLKFMGKKWDYQIPSIDIWKECLRVCKPGSMMLAFGGTRTYHRLTCAIEDAGWEVRDCLMWIYGSGFPKSHNKFGLEGYGTALKPAYEPILMCMKPLDGTYAQNAEKWGVGGINIDACRIETKDNLSRLTSTGGGYSGGWGDKRYLFQGGRWPANVLFDEEAAAQLDEMSGILKSGEVKPYKRLTNDQYSGSFPDNINSFEPSLGGASRFFYCAKASSKERNAGLEGMPFIEKSNGNKWTDQDYRVTNGERPHSAQSGPRQNHHPTVKPIKLLEYLLTLIKPPGDPVVLDPFMGSGSTLIAAKNLGIRSIGIEIDKSYCEIAQKRIGHAMV